MSMLVAVLILMSVGVALSAVMVLPRLSKIKTKKEKEKATRNETGKILEGECSDWKLWVIRGFCLVAMAIATQRLYESSGTVKEVLAWCFMYAGAFLAHYGVLLVLKRRYYFSPKGIWINQLEGEPIPYEKVEVLKCWRTCAPFSGCAGNLIILIRADGRKHRVLFPKEDEEENRMNGIEHSAQTQVLKWLPKVRQKEIGTIAPGIWKKAGIFCIVTGISATLLFGFFMARGIGAFEPMSGSEDYGQARMRELAVHGVPDAAYEAEDGDFYIMFRDFSCVNRYDPNGNFLYAYQIPKGRKGAMEFSVKGDELAIKNRDDRVFVYKDAKLIKEESLKAFMRQGRVSFVPEGNALDKAALIRKQPGLLPGDEALPYAILGFVLTLCGATLYNKGRFAIR